MEAASNDAVDRSVRSYRDDLDRADSLGDLLAIGDTLRRRERDNGNVTFMAQVMAGAQHDPVLTRAAHYAMSAWIRELRAVLDRVLRHGGLAEVIDMDGLAPLIAIGFIGLGLCEAVDPTGATDALAALESLGALVTTLDGLGPPWPDVRSVQRPNAATSNRHARPPVINRPESGHDTRTQR